MRASDRGVGGRQSGPRFGFLGEKREAEVGDLDHRQSCRQRKTRRRIDQEEIRWLDVSMHDPEMCGMGQSGRRLPRKAPGGCLGHAAQTFDALLDVFAFDELHREEQPPRMSAEVVCGDDVRVLQAGDGDGFLLESCGGPRGRQLADEHRLQRHDPLQGLLPGAEHHAHPPLPHEVQDLVSGNDGRRPQQRLDDVDLRDVQDARFQGDLRGGQATLRRIAQQRVGRRFFEKSQRPGDSPEAELLRLPIDSGEL